MNIQRIKIFYPGWNPNKESLIPRFRLCVSLILLHKIVPKLPLGAWCRNPSKVLVIINQKIGEFVYNKKSPSV